MQLWYVDEPDWFPTKDEYDPKISLEQWVGLLNDKNVFTEDNLLMMARFIDYGGEATCTELSNKYGEEVNFYNSGSSSLAQRIHKATNCPVMEKNEKDLRWWPILYVGKQAEKEQTGSFIWKLREELRETLEQVELPDSLPEVITIKSFDSYSKEEFLSEVYITEEEYDILNSLLKRKKNIILQGAPGVGKTFASKRLAYAMMGEVDEDRIEFIQFHQNYSYEDFIMGYKPVGETFELKYGVFYNFCKKAENDPDKSFFFFIDEINRGNMSKIFGELLMLIEKDYRNKIATLVYNGKSFSVPDNLYIIGMMNTADRSLAMIDYALRRRFSFYEMVPGFDSEGFRTYQRKLNDERFDTLIEKIKDLNKDITFDNSLGKGFTIGDSYFCGEEVSSDEWLRQVVEYDILPMLSEYWFDEPEKLQGWGNILRGVFDD